MAPSSSNKSTATLAPLSQEEDEFYMRQALAVARNALDLGEVPVGCVIVATLQPEGEEVSSRQQQAHLSSARTVIISHGANQVNATRDATRHAEIVAIDRMLTLGVSSDQLRLPPTVFAQSARNDMLPADSPLLKHKNEEDSQLLRQFEDKWLNVPNEPSHWKNSYGWGSGRAFDAGALAHCCLYVTCEPCIMCAAALAQVGIGRVAFGCHNDKFGGCGSILNLHEESLDSTGKCYPIQSGVLKEEAIELLRSFYSRENFNAPDDKRKRKDGSKGKEE